MGLARVVAFDGVSKERMEEQAREIQEGERPEGLPATEIVALHNPDDETALVILFFDTEDDYQVADKTLNEMPADETPGERTSVTKYNVSVRMTA